MKKRAKVVICVFTDGEKILTEKRLLENYSEWQTLIPGGGVEDFETIEQALKREVFEELGVIPLEFIVLPKEEQILGLNNQIIVPFLITKWQGELPEKILDSGNRLEWMIIEEVLNSPIKPTKKIVEALRKYLSKS
ncbi:NUDIX hydrolase [Candidatus Daviesbacteria bacterium]|nr:NUDIX hydrolase [Candidatus Daviesbacteria bacterium]MBI4038810.1 NUDIX hydrolase [Candidatus Daviesbacteria bacterium]